MTEGTELLVDGIESLPDDVREVKLDLEPDQKMRMVALMLGIKYYTDTIIKDAAYLQLMMQREKEAKFSNDPTDAVMWHLKPASVNGVIGCAQEFEQFLLGNRPGVVLKIGDETITPPPHPSDSERAQSNMDANQ